MPANPGYRRMHTGTTYLLARKEMFRLYGDVCWICGHRGANEADYLVPVSVDPYQKVCAEAMRPAHGVRSPCRDSSCMAKPHCNQTRGNRPPRKRVHHSRNW